MGIPVYDRLMRSIALAVHLIAAMPAAAQESPKLEPEESPVDPGRISASARLLAEREKTESATSVFDGDYAIVGVGVAGMPTYEGSDRMRAVPGIAAVGRVGGIGFRLRGPSLATDLIDDPEGARIGLRLGPTIRYRSNRKSHIGDEVVARLGTLDDVVEVGVGGGVNFRKVLSRQDNLSLGGGVRWDITGRNGAMTASASVNYLLPLSRAQVIGMHVSGEFMDDDHADYNFTVTPQGSAASGLPAYKAKGGFKELNLGAFTARDLNGNFLDGGFAVGAGAMYSRLYGSAARSPITSERGSRNQWLLAAGVAYTF